MNTNKKVLVLSASPRKGGNSELLCDEFIKGVQELGHSAEKIFLSDKNINYCKGCGVCNSSKKCVQQDDMAEILDKMINSDVIVMATPVYFYTMDGQLKTFIDRTVTKYTEIRNKDFYFIMTAADGRKQAMDGTLTEFSGFLSCLNGATQKGAIYGIGAWNIGDIQGKPSMKEAYDMGKKI